jgi:hypothetical protein
MPRVDVGHEELGNGITPLCTVANMEVKEGNGYSHATWKGWDRIFHATPSDFWHLDWALGYILEYANC